MDGSSATDGSTPRQGDMKHPETASGDAAAASAALEAFLRQRPAPRSTDKVLLSMRTRLEELGGAVRRLDDREARQLYQDLGRTQTIEDLHAGLDRLAARITKLLHVRNRRAASPDRHPVRKTRTLIRL